MRFDQRPARIYLSQKIFITLRIIEYSISLTTLNSEHLSFEIYAILAGAPHIHAYSQMDSILSVGHCAKPHTFIAFAIPWSS